MLACDLEIQAVCVVGVRENHESDCSKLLRALHTWMPFFSVQDSQKDVVTLARNHGAHEVASREVRSLYVLAGLQHDLVVR